MAEADRSRSSAPSRNRQDQPTNLGNVKLFRVLTNHATTSERTKTATVKTATVPAGTLWDGTCFDTNATVLSANLGRALTISTNSTTYASTNHNSNLSSFHVSSDTTLLTFSTNSHFTISTSISWHHA
jgi:hypothetical protein